MSVPAIAFSAHGRPGFFYGRKVLQSVAAESPAVSCRLVNGSEDRSQGYYYMKNDATFDSNLVIILAALLCSLMCALGLSTMVRCALRCSRGGTVFESPDGVAVRLANTGLKRAAMKALPTVVYGKESLTPVVGVDCPICLAEFVEGESVKVLPQCNHGFHVDCIDTWLRSHSSCPTCRRNLLGALAKRSGAGVACGTHTRQTGDSSEGGARDTSAMPTSVPPSSDSTADADVEAGIVGENPGPC